MNVTKKKTGWENLTRHLLLCMHVFIIIFFKDIWEKYERVHLLKSETKKLSTVEQK